MRSQISASQSEPKKATPSFQQQNHTKNPLDFFVERGGKVIQDEFGWCNYYVFPSGVAYLENMFIYPEYRGTHKFHALLMRLETQLQELEGVKEYFTTISRIMGKCEKTLAISLKMGFKFHSSNDDGITLRKEL